MIKSNGLGRAKKIAALMLSASLLFGEATVSFAAERQSYLSDQENAIEVTDDSAVTGDFTPGKVTNVGFKKPASTGVYNKDYLSWDAVTGADSYQIRYIDASGKEYGNLDDYVSDDKYKTIDYPSTTSLGYYLNSYINSFFVQIENKNGLYSFVKDSDGNYIWIIPGNTYKVQVRAVHEGNKTTYGEWSNPVSYFAEKQNADKVTDIHIEENDFGTYKLVFSSTGYVDVEIKDAAGNYYYDYVSDIYDKNHNVKGTDYRYLHLSSSTGRDGYYFNEQYTYIYAKEKGYDFYMPKVDEYGNRIIPFVPNETYTIRLRGRGTNDKGETILSEWSSPLTVKVPLRKKPEKTGNLKYYPNDNQVGWNSVISAEGYEFELKDVGGKNNQLYTLGGYIFSYSSYFDLDDLCLCTINSDGSYTVVKDSNGKEIKAGQNGKKYTLRVRACNKSNKKDAKTGEYPLQFSDWSDTITFEVPASQNDDISKLKVKGLRFTTNDSKGTLNWEVPDNLPTPILYHYELELKDSLNRTYNSIDNDSKGNKILTYIFTDKTSISNIYTYVKIDDEYEAVVDSKGKAISTFVPGLKYTARVRLVANVDKADGTTETKYSAWSDYYNFTVPAKASSEGINSKPSKVTGLWADDKAGEKGNQYDVYLRWNRLENVSGYEIEVKDSSGNLFSESPYLYDDTLYNNYYSNDDGNQNYVALGEFARLESYKKVKGSALSRLRDSNGDIVHPMINGQTYTFRVRAINSYQKRNSDGTLSPEVDYIGDWSDPISYTVTNSDLKVTGLKYVKSDDDYYYFDVTGDQKYSELYYQVATDDKFTKESLVIGWSPIYVYNINGTDYKFTIPKEYLDASKKYYVRVVNSRYGHPDYVADDYSKNIYNSVIATAAKINFTSDANKNEAAKDITGLKLCDESAERYYFRFDAKLKEEDGDYYEVQINNVNADNSNWASIDNTRPSDASQYDFYIQKNELLEGSNYIRVRAYKYINNKKTGSREKVYGKPSNVVAVNGFSTVVSSIGTLSLDEESDSHYYFRYTGDIKKEEKINVFFSTSSSFDTNDKDDIYDSDFYVSIYDNKRFRVNKDAFRPGRTYYLKARVVNENVKKPEEKESAYSNVIKFTTVIPKTVVRNTAVTKNSITIRMNIDSFSEWLSGYQVQKKESGKWKDKAKSSASTFTDKKLKAFKTYSYRIRPYFFDKDTKKTTYGDWVYKDIMTGWSGNLNLKAKAASKTSVKLSWNKVKGAKGYEVYRLVASSDTTKFKNGENNSYSSYKLVKTLGSGKKSYTDKKLTNGMTYEYVVKTYKKVGGKKVYIQDSAKANLDFYLQEINRYQKSDGKYTITWNPVMSAKGYKIEKKDPQSDKWTVYKNIKKAKTSSVTLPASKDYENGDKYRIYAYNGKKITNEISVTVNPVLATPTNVKASVSGNKITISWKKVNGADYYRVFRAFEPSTAYSADFNSGLYNSWIEVGRYVPDPSAVKGFRYRYVSEMNVTSVVDQEIRYTKNGIPDQIFYQGPVTGTKYYYFVVAYKLKPQHGYIPSDRSIEDKSGYVIESRASVGTSAMIKETKPAKPVLSSISSKKKTVSVSIKGSVKADGYEIYRSTNKKKNFKSVGEITGASPIYKDKYNKKKNKLKKGKTYYYKVRAFVYNEDGTKVYSAYSSVKKVKFK